MFRVGGGGGGGYLLYLVFWHLSYGVIFQEVIVLIRLLLLLDCIKKDTLICYGRESMRNDSIDGKNRYTLARMIHSTYV